MTKRTFALLVLLFIVGFNHELIASSVKSYGEELGFIKNEEIISGVVSEKNLETNVTSRVSHTIVVNGLPFIITKQDYDSISVGDTVQIKHLKGVVLYVIRVQTSNTN